MTAHVVPDPLPELPLSSLRYTVGHYLPRDRFATAGSDVDPWDFDAPYQRGSVWSDDQRRALIKSFLLRIPVGTVTVASLPYDRPKYLRVVDGKQRILAARAFVAGEFKVPGWWFGDGDVDSPVFRTVDVYYSGLSDRGQRRITMAALPCEEFKSANRYVRRPDGRYDTIHRTAAETIAAEAEVFGLINGGGVAQTDESMSRAARIAGSEFA